MNILSGGSLIQQSILNPTSTLFAGVEFFDPASSFTVTNWFSITLPLINSVSSNFGNVALNLNTGAGWWNNQGLGVTRLVQGNLSVGANCQTFLDNTVSPVNINIGGGIGILAKS